MDQIGNRIYVLIGLASATITIVPFAVSDTVRLWVRNHSNWLYGVLVLLVLAVTIFLGYTRDLNRRYQELDAASRRPSSNDINMLREIMVQVPRDGALMTWLKAGFFVKAIPYAKIEALDQVCLKLNMNPLEFDDQEVGSAYHTFMSAIEDFRALTTLHCNFEDNREYDTLRVPLPIREGEEKGYYRALEEINEEVDKLTSAYDDFLRTCSTNGLDIYSADAS